MVLRNTEKAQFTSLNYPNRYPNNAYRMWNVTAPRGFLLSIRSKIMDIADDFIYIGDGITNFSLDSESCSQWKSVDKSSDFNFTSRSSSIMLIFTTGFTRTGNGFYIDMEPVRLDHHRMYTAGKINVFLPMFLGGGANLITLTNNGQ